MTNEAKDQVPEWAQEAAAKIAAEAIELHTDQEIEGLSQEIARALLAAERRGIERAADHLSDLAKETPLGHENVSRGRSTYNWLSFCSDATRRLGEAE